VTAAIVIRRLSIGRGARWIVEAFQLFRRQALAWVLVHLGLVLVALGCVALKTVGLFLFLLILPVLMGGLMSACREQEHGQVVEIGHLFLGFRKHATALVTVGGLHLVGQVLITGVTMWLGGDALQELLRAASEGVAPASIDPSVVNRASLAMLAALALAIPLAMAVWFAPALVSLEGITAWRALGLSLRACVRNVLPFLTYGAAMTGLLMLALATYMVGMVLWLPLATLTVYTAYRDIFSPRAAPEAAAPG
jgi:uncharacterized membrane protein